MGCGATAADAVLMGYRLGYILDVLISPRPQVFSTADIAAVLSDLQARANDAASLRTWAQDANVAIERVVATDDLTYVRLAARDDDGSPIVLMLLEGVWERAV